MSGWTRDEALTLVAALWPSLKAVGYYVGLTGSVLVKGTSRNDLDLIVYPASTTSQDKNRVVGALMDAGLTRLTGRDGVHRRWRRLGSSDEKHVEVWELDGKKVDVFFLS